MAVSHLCSRGALRLSTGGHSSILDSIQHEDEGRLGGLPATSTVRAVLTCAQALKNQNLRQKGLPKVDSPLQATGGLAALVCFVAGPECLSHHV